jgi:hypothetical protein
VLGRSCRRSGANASRPRSGSAPAAPEDEINIRQFVETHAADIDNDLAEVILRQNQPGKRMAIGLILRGMSRHGVEPDDLVIFMDGDAVYGGDVLEKTLSMFGADPELQALTTDEEVMCFGPEWIASLAADALCPAPLAMQSHAVSNRVLTLTGRFSVFRAATSSTRSSSARSRPTIWTTGFGAGSGSCRATTSRPGITCSSAAKMTYVPDATVYTIEVIKGSGCSGWSRISAAGRATCCATAAAPWRLARVRCRPSSGGACRPAHRDVDDDGQPGPGDHGARS